MNKNLILSIILAFSLLLVISSYITSAFLITDTYKMKGEITGGGSANLTFGSPIQNISKIAVGQSVIGLANNTTADLKICFGVFCTGIYQPFYSMNFTGRLNYSNGSAIVYAPIKVIVKYLISQYEGSNWTDGLGNFFVKINNLPEYFIHNDLNITLFVQSEVEAIYKCWYNHTSTNCCKEPITQHC